ncbi:MAG: DUF1707 domain-containing protein [Pseudonocardiaceae bacterium]|nr:DUF1707 domain-containing protein [Pseudonocardiaceae bacterium]
MRAADTDREAVVEQLRHGHAEGRLDLDEFDERVQRAWAARTYGELDVIAADLPDMRPATAAPEVPGDVVSHEDGQRGAVLAWLSVSLVNVVIWAVVCLATVSWIYPWWVWVAGPWGAVLLAGAVAGRAGCGRRAA